MASTSGQKRKHNFCVLCRYYEKEKGLCAEIQYDDERLIEIKVWPAVGDLPEFDMRKKLKCIGLKFKFYMGNLLVNVILFLFPKV